MVFACTVSFSWRRGRALEGRAWSSKGMKSGLHIWWLTWCVKEECCWLVRVARIRGPTTTHTDTFLMTLWSSEFFGLQQRSRVNPAVVAIDFLCVHWFALYTAYLLLMVHWYLSITGTLADSNEYIVYEAARCLIRSPSRLFSSLLELTNRTVFPSIRLPFGYSLQASPPKAPNPL